VFFFLLSDGEKSKVGAKLIGSLFLSFLRFYYFVTKKSQRETYVKKKERKVEKYFSQI